MSDVHEPASPIADRSAEPGTVPDELLSQLIGVGQVDLLIGVATLGHANSIGALVHSASLCAGTFFPRLRTALLHVDRGSIDGTAASGRAAWESSGHERGARALRTSHFIGTSVNHASEGDAARVVLAAADLLQARALVVVDADAESVSPHDIAALATPVVEGRAAVVAALYPREPATGLLVSQLVRPLTGATFGVRLSEPLLPTFACSGAFAAHATQLAWQTTRTERLTRYWIAAAALDGAFDTQQCPLGPRRARSTPHDEGLPAIFGRVVSSVFSSLDARADTWLAATEFRDLPGVRAAPPHAGVAPATVSPRWQEAFARDVQDITEILARIVSPETWAALQAAVADVAHAGFPDGLWAEVLVDFLLSFHHKVMLRDHIAQALLPLYRARSSAFVQEHGSAAAAAGEEAVRALGTCVEAARPRLVQQWTSRNEVEHG